MYFVTCRYVLRFIPTSIVWAFFAFMALESLPGNQLWDRLQVSCFYPFSQAAKKLKEMDVLTKFVCAFDFNHTNTDCFE